MITQYDYALAYNEGVESVRLALRSLEVALAKDLKLTTKRRELSIELTSALSEEISMLKILDQVDATS